jgi:uncharacterized protein
VERFEAVWAPWEGHGMERLRVAVGPEAVYAEGDVLDPTGLGIHYRIRADAGWTTRHVEVTLVEERPRMLRLHADGEGGWTDDAGAALPELAGCLDVDLSFSPFTNTLAIRRLALAEGEHGDTRVALVSLPELTVAPDPQRYTRLAADRYRFDSLDSDFTRELALDEHSLVLDYPGLFRRLHEH